MGISTCTVGSYLVSPTKPKAMVIMVSRNSFKKTKEREKKTQYNIWVIVMLLVLLVAALTVLCRVVLLLKSIVQQKNQSKLSSCLWQNHREKIASKKTKLLGSFFMVG